MYKNKRKYYRIKQKKINKNLRKNINLTKKQKENLIYSIILFLIINFLTNIFSFKIFINKKMKKKLL